MRTIAATAALAALFASFGSGPSALADAQLHGKITVRCTGKLSAQEVTNGGVAARGRFVASGVISDSGTFTDYRTQRGTTIKVRRVTVGSKGWITYAIKINTATASDHWTISSATRAYKGLRGSGTESSNTYSTPAHFTLTGTITR